MVAHLLGEIVRVTSFAFTMMGNLNHIDTHGNLKLIDVCHLKQIVDPRRGVGYAFHKIEGYVIVAGSYILEEVKAGDEFLPAYREQISSIRIINKMPISKPGRS